MWNYGYTQHVFNMGYPWENTSGQAIASAGAYLRLCTAETFSLSTDVMGEGCNYGPGISGGPWMVGSWPNVAQGNVDSVNSGYYVGYTNLYGIRFNSNNIVVVCTTRGC